VDLAAFVGVVQRGHGRQSARWRAVDRHNMAGQRPSNPTFRGTKSYFDHL
jgi:hypothetical protein